MNSHWRRKRVSIFQRAVKWCSKVAKIAACHMCFRGVVAIKNACERCPESSLIASSESSDSSASCETLKVSCNSRLCCESRFTWDSLRSGLYAFHSLLDVGWKLRQSASTCRPLLDDADTLVSVLHAPETMLDLAIHASLNQTRSCIHRTLRRNPCTPTGHVRFDGLQSGTLGRRFQAVSLQLGLT